MNICGINSVNNCNKLFQDNEKDEQISTDEQEISSEDNKTVIPESINQSLQVIASDQPSPISTSMISVDEIKEPLKTVAKTPKPRVQRTISTRKRTIKIGE